MTDRSTPFVERRRLTVPQFASEDILLAFNAGRAAVWKWDVENGRISFTGPFDSLLGLPVQRSSLLLDEFEAMIHEDDRKAARAARGRSWRGDGAHDVQYRLGKAGGPTRWVLDRGRLKTPPGASSPTVVGMLADITELKALENDLRTAADRLSDSNERLEHLAFASAHDLQVPLRHISNFADVLKDECRDLLQPEHLGTIDRMIDTIERLRVLVHDSLRYARLGYDHINKAKVDLNAVFDRAVDDLDPMIREEGARVTRDRLPVVEAAEDQLYMVFLNLIGNAVKYRGERPPGVHVSAAYQSPEWIVSIRDNGIGIDSSNIGRVFDSFRRLHGPDRFPGTGIGLAICKKIIQAHGGRIWADSKEGVGTTFYFSLPSGPDAADGPAGPPPSPGPMPSKSPD